MAWTYYCDEDKSTMTGATKEELAQKLIEHLKDGHDIHITMDQAMESVNKNAREMAA